MLGQTFSHYRIVESLGAGGMGVVYKAIDTVLERTVALKVMNAAALADPSLSRRFLQEARSAAALHHPNIATIFEASEFEGTTYIAMEFVEGQSLRARIDAGLTLDEALRIANDIVAGLVHAHEHRVVHRDLKPDNVLVTAHGPAKILDFGLAKVLRETAASTDATVAATMLTNVTTHGQIIGTPAYMSPEQARGLDVDFRSDLFSFGSILHEMVTGKRAFEGKTPLDVLSAILKDPPAPPSRVDVTLPPEIDRIVGRLLEKDPNSRYATTRELQEDLQALSAKTTHTAGAGRVAARRAQRVAGTRNARAIGAAAGIAALVAAIVAVKPWNRAPGDASARGDKAAAGAAAATRPPSWILVSDFAGTGIQPDLAVATRELVAAALGQSDVVTPIPRQAIQHQMRLAEMPDTTKVMGAVAQQLAVRAAARTYLEGRIDKVLTSYSIVLDVKNAENNASQFIVRGTAAKDEDVIGKLDAMARELREKLGDRKADVGRTMELREVLTANFDAYRAYSQATTLQYERKYAPSNHLLRSAIGLDPSFASAWKLMGVNYLNLVMLDSARVAFTTAQQHQERLTPDEKLGLDVFLAYSVEYDLPKADELYQAAANTKISATQTNNRGTVLFGLGRYEDALAAQVRAGELDPFGQELFVYNQFRTLIQLGRTKEARELLPKLSGASLELAKLEVAIAEGGFASADSLARVLATDPSPGLSYQAKLVLAGLEARRGAARSADRAFTALVQQPIPFYGSLAEMARLHLALALGSTAESAIAPDDTTSAGWILRGIAAATKGDVATAQRALTAVRSKPVRERRRYAVDADLLEGWIALAEKRWDDVTIRLTPAMESGPGPWFVGRPAIRWLVAQAYERAGGTEEAVRAYQAVLDPTREHHDVWTWWAVLWPFAHERLAILEAGAGRMDRAQKHLEALEAAWGKADPELKARLDEVRRAVRSAA